MKLKHKTKETLIGYAFLAPALVIFITLVGIPIVISFLLSFTKWNFFSGISQLKFVGFDNFMKLLTTDRAFKTALANTIIYTVTTVPLTIFISMLFAHVINGRVHLQKFQRLAFFVPYISNMVALGAVFKFLFRTDGPVNAILSHVFQVKDTPNWLVSTSLSRIPIIGVMIYSGIGFCLIVYIAAIKNVPQHLYEAAKIDGASSIRQFFSITIPMISPTTLYLVIVRMISAFQVFAPINVISDGGKNAGNTSLVVMLYEEAFRSYNFCYASAISWILVLFILVVTLINFHFQKKWVHY